LGNFVPSTGPALEKGQFVGVSAPIGKSWYSSRHQGVLYTNLVKAIGLLVMMYPILCKVQYETLHLAFKTKELWIQVGFSILVNWLIAPFLMLALSWAFLPDEPGLREGLILVGVARCIAMVLIWTGLAGGDSQVCRQRQSLVSTLSDSRVVLCYLSRHQLDTPDGSVRTPGHILHQRHQPLAVNNHALVLNSSHQRCRIPRNPSSSGHHHSLRHPQNLTHLVRSDVHQMGCTMVLDRPSLHHHRAFRITRPPRGPSNRLGRASSSTFNRLLFRHLQRHLVDHAQTWIWIQVGSHAEFHCCE
jgi:hypothetical protein